MRGVYLVSLFVCAWIPVFASLHQPVLRTRLASLRKTLTDGVVLSQHSALCSPSWAVVCRVAHATLRMERGSVTNDERGREVLVLQDNDIVFLLECEGACTPPDNRLKFSQRVGTQVS